MAHFAQIDENNIVTQVIVVHNSVTHDENGVEQESLGIEFCKNLLGGNWVQTSYNGNIRTNYAGIGFTYDKAADAFIPPQPYPSWILDTQTYQWRPPVPFPTDGQTYKWNEETQSWDLVSPTTEETKPIKTARLKSKSTFA